MWGCVWEINKFNVWRNSKHYDINVCKKKSIINYERFTSYKLMHIIYIFIYILYIIYIFHSLCIKCRIVTEICYRLQISFKFFFLFVLNAYTKLKKNSRKLEMTVWRLSHCWIMNIGKKAIGFRITNILDLLPSSGKWVEDT